MSNNELPEELAHAFRVGEDGRMVLIAGRTPDGRLSFPRPDWCGEDLVCPETVEVAGEGEIHCHTIIRTKAPYGLPTPYAVGYVDIDGTGLRVFGLLEGPILDNLAPGQRVRLGARPLGVDNGGHACLRPVFSVAGGACP